MEASKKRKISAGLGLLAAIIYVIVPTDLMPDVVPMMGWIDDTIAILLAVGNALRLLKRK